MEFLHAYKALKQEQGGVVYNGNDVLRGAADWIRQDHLFPSAILLCSTTSSGYSEYGEDCASFLFLNATSWAIAFSKKEIFCRCKKRKNHQLYWYQNIQEGAESTGQAAQLPNNTTLVLTTIELLHKL